MLWGGRWEGGSCLGTHVRLKILKLKKIKNKNKNTHTHTKRLGIKLPYDPTVSLLGICPEETIIEKDRYPMFIAALFNS